MSRGQKETSMKKSTASFITLLIVACCGLPELQGEPDNKTSATGVQLIEVGEFHGEEIAAKTGEQWLGLFVSDGEAALVFTTVRVEQFHDEIVDHEPDAMTGKRVSIADPTAPLFLLRGADMLQPGQVATAHSEAVALTKQSDIELELAGIKYRLNVVTKDKRRDSSMFLDDAKLVFSSAGREQTLYALGGKGLHEADVSWSLLWAGDLDRDDRLDLYVQVSSHYNVTERKLFLSSQAKKKQLVRELAAFVTTGC